MYTLGNFAHCFLVFIKKLNYINIHEFDWMEETFVYYRFAKFHSLLISIFFNLTTQPCKCAVVIASKKFLKFFFSQLKMFLAYNTKFMPYKTFILRQK